DLPAVAAAVLVEPAHGEDGLEPEVRPARDERAVAGGPDVVGRRGDVEGRGVGRGEGAAVAGANEVGRAAEDVDALVEALDAAVGGEQVAGEVPAAGGEEGAERVEAGAPAGRFGAGDAGEEVSPARIGHDEGVEREAGPGEG